MTRGPTRESVARASRRASYAFAATFVALAALLLAPGPTSGAGRTVGTASSDPHAAWPVLVLLAFAFACSVVARAVVTRRASDAVLAAFSTPCLLVSLWGLLEAVAPSGGVAWGNLGSLVAGTLLAVVVLADAVLARVADRRTGVDAP